MSSLYLIYFSQVINGSMVTAECLFMANGMIGAKAAEGRSLGDWEEQTVSQGGCATRRVDCGEQASVADS
jgi:hypothetical protein